MIIIVTSNALCRSCGKSPKRVLHVLAGCGTLIQTKYLTRHNAARKILFCEMLKALERFSEEPPWYSKTQRKLLHKNGNA